jgi:eukaryotic-like serine/threonine-protein kinase
VLRIAREVAGALDYSHRRGVVHRDIKPENILLQDGQAIVADFGIARAIDAAGADRVGEPGAGTGTPAYMSPEQASPGADVDRRTDIYALGCVLYEMLAGAPPFNGPTVQAILEQHAADPVPSLRVARPDIPFPLEQAVTRALQKAPADRFATAGEFVEAIDLAAGAAAPERSAARVPRWVFLGVAAAAVLTVTLGSLMWRPSSASPLDPSLVAILPFRIAGSNPELTWLREGLVDLLAIKLAGEGGLRVAEPRAVLSAWGRAAGSSGQEVTPKAALAIARGFGAGRIIDGAVVGHAGHLTLTASLLTTPAGRRRFESGRPLSESFCPGSTSVLSGFVAPAALPPTVSFPVSNVPRNPNRCSRSPSRSRCCSTWYSTTSARC